MLPFPLEDDCHFKIPQFVLRMAGSSPRAPFKGRICICFLSLTIPYDAVCSVSLSCDALPSTVTETQGFNLASSNNVLALGIQLLISNPEIGDSCHHNFHFLSTDF